MTINSQWEWLWELYAQWYAHWTGKEGKVVI